MELSRRNFLGLMALSLGSCSSEIRPNTAFQEQDFYYLSSEFEKRGLCNKESPLFDFNDLAVREAYEQAKLVAKPRVIEADMESSRHIEETVKKHLEFYGGRSLIIISGAGFHIWEAARNLENKLDVSYISVTPKKLNLKEHAERKEAIREQFTRALEVVRFLGYESLEDYFNRGSYFDKPRGIIVGIEETGLHLEYNKDDFKGIYRVLTDFIDRFQPRSILYFRENLSFETSPHKDFFSKIKGRPVELAFFGDINI